MSKKVLHVIDSMGLWWAQTVVKWIFEKQIQNNDIFLYALRKRDINIDINHNNIFTYDSDNKFSFPIYKLIDFIKEKNIEILHCHLAKSQIIWYVLKLLFFPNIKLVLHEHWEIFENWKIYPFLMNLFRKKVDLYIAVSKATKQKILDKTNYKEEKVEVLYNFVDLDKFKKIENFDIISERKKYLLDKNDFVIGFASRLYEWKWYMDFLESAKILLEKWYNLKFLLAWDWDDKQKIIDYVNKNNLQDSIKIVWYINDMVWFYNIIDCFVFPSHREALPMTILEVNWVWKPIIVSNIPWVNEIMINWKNALLFEKQNVENLTEKIEKIHNDTELKDSLIKNWLEEVKKYSLEKYLIKIWDIYEKL